MDRREWDQRQDFAKSEGASYYDPDNPTVWKQYIVGPVPLWGVRCGRSFLHHTRRCAVFNKNDTAGCGKIDMAFLALN
jgi:hypothetical protein